MKKLCFAVFIFALFSVLRAESFFYDFESDYLQNKNFAPDFIVNGHQSTEVYGWIAALVDDKLGQFCGGSLIDKDWVLTAGHCITDAPGAGINPQNMTVVVGTNNFTKGGESVKVTQIIVHENYKNTQFDKFNDIALLKLSKSVTSVTPVTMTLPSEMEELAAPGTMATAAGWGFFKEGGPDYPEDIYEVDLPIVSLTECQNRYPGQINETNICTAIVDGKDTCQGDSGGPLFLKNNGDYKLLGIVSWGMGCARAGHYGVFANASYFIDWINKKAGDIITINLPESGSSLCSELYLCADECEKDDAKCRDLCRRKGTPEAQGVFDEMISCFDAKCKSASDYNLCISEKCSKEISSCFNSQSEDDDSVQNNDSNQLPDSGLTENDAESGDVDVKEENDNLTASKDDENIEENKTSSSSSSGGCSILTL